MGRSEHAEDDLQPPLLVAQSSHFVTTGMKAELGAKYFNTVLPTTVCLPTTVTGQCGGARVKHTPSESTLKNVKWPSGS